MIQGFRFNNPKQCSNWIILVSFCSSHFAIKNCYNVHFMKIEKIGAKIDFSAKNSKKFMYYNEELVHKFKFQTQLSRKLQRFRTCRKNKKCSIFYDLSEYIIFSYGCKLLDWSFRLDTSCRTFSSYFFSTMTLKVFIYRTFGVIW